MSGLWNRAVGKFHDLVNMTKKYKGEAHEFFLDFGSWKTFKTKHKLVWERVPFIPDSKKLIPNERGIYVFTALAGDDQFPIHGYLLYVGITGDGDSKSNLRTRYGQYERQLKNEDGRPAVYYMMAKWRNDLMFNFVKIADPKIDLGEMESDFINAVMPPVNKRDFEAMHAAVRQSAF